MTEVRICLDGGTESHHLGDVPLDKIDTVIPTLNRWGVYTDNCSPFETAVSGNFRVTETGAYFEVTVTEAE